MKKIIILTLILLLTINIAFAEDLTILNTNYNPGETVQAYITDSTITTSQISVLDPNLNSISITPLLIEYKDNNYLTYFNLPTTLEQGTYKLITKSLEKNFTVSNATKATQIKPGIIILTKDKTSFSIALKNIGETNTVQITSSDPNISPRKSTLSLNTGETKNLLVDYTYKDITEDSTLTIKYETQTYTIPIIYPIEIVEENETVENITEEVIPEEIINPLSFATDSVDRTIIFNETFDGFLDVTNNGEENLTDLKFSITGSLSRVMEINKTEISELKGGENFSQYVWVNRNKDKKAGEYSGELILSNEQYEVKLPVSITIEELEIIEEPPEETIVNETIQYNLSELFEGELEEETKISATTIIGIVLIILLIAILIIVFRKMQTENKKKFNKYIEETKRK